MKSMHSQEYKNTSNTNQREALGTLNNLSEYDKSMIEKYQSEIKDGTVAIQRNQDLTSLNFIRLLNLNELVLKYCQRIIPKLESQSIKKLEIIDSKIQSVKDFRLDNLEVLDIQNYFQYLESKTLIFEIVMFQKLKELYLYSWEIDISPLSQMTGLSKLSLIQCNLRSTKVLRPLINLKELNIGGNDIDITTVQYLTNLTKLSLECCNLVNIDALRELTQLEELNISTNSIIYIQPLMGLKQLSRLEAINNYIIDSKSIQQHPNFEMFNLSDQEKPTKLQVREANILKLINSPIIYQKQIYKKSSHIQLLYTIFKKKVIQQLQKYNIFNEQFHTRAVQLFQRINVFEDCQ
ncbi:leucine-rich_repeat domain-containing protein [Hexamita inflata]|uniref:Leucine-rich repeat domain-containing protein n=1 Tax=Hexamita inflata TaxID=28002 RepID=A0AA86QYZ0_9EUKA|nr:leucine-rich repeat domain-containing protein [Hexamita inflata]